MLNWFLVGSNHLRLEAPDAHGMFPKYMNSVSNHSLVGQHLRNITFRNLESDIGLKWYHGEVVDAPDSHGILVTLTPNLLKKNEIIHMLRMRKVGSSLPLQPHLPANRWRLGKSAETPCHTLASNDTMVQWYRHQTHMEFFQSIHMVYEIMQMLWTVDEEVGSSWCHYKHTCQPRSQKYLLKSWVRHWPQMIPWWSGRGSRPTWILFTLTPNIHKKNEIIQMLRMRKVGSSLQITTTRASEDLGTSAETLFHTLASNDTMVKW